MRTVTLTIATCISFLLNLNAQEINVTPKKINKGKIYAFWGWNRAAYTNSDINFSGDNYNFTLSNVVAKDRQTPFAPETYLNPLRMTIPQTNLRVGYFFNEHYNISGGVDHMKYVMQNDQTVKINGSIANSGTEYDKTYKHDDIVLAPNFLLFEHTDGLNYVNVAISRFDNLINLKNLTNANIDINLTEGFGTGFLLPKTNATLLNNPRNDEFHLAGYGFDVKAGLNITFFNYFFLQTESKAGFINMPDIRTTPSEADRASQHFFFYQQNFLFGAIFPIPTRKSKMAAE